MAPSTTSAAPSECTPLINDIGSSQATTTATHPSSTSTLDVECGVSNGTLPANGSDKATASPSPPSVPTWSAALSEVAPFLHPRDQKHALLLYSALGTVLLEKITGVLPPLAIRRAVDAISDYYASPSSSSSSDITDAATTTEHIVGMSILAYFLLKSIDSIIGSVQSVCQRAVSLDAERRFATTLFAHVQVLGPSYHLERHAGDVLRVLSRGSDATSTIIDSLWFGLFPTFFEAAAVGTIFAKVLGVPCISLTTIASVCLYLTYTVKVTNTRLNQRRRVNEKNEAVGRIEAETLINYETVAIFGRERQAALEYDVLRGDYAEERVRMIGLFAWLSLGQDSIRLGGMCIGLWLAGHAAVQGTLSPGSFVVVQLYINQLFQPLSYLGYTYRQLTEALADLEKAVKMLKSKPSVMESTNAVEWDVALEQRRHEETIGDDRTATSGGDISFEDVSFQYKIKGQRKKLGGGEIGDVKHIRDGKANPKMKGFWKGKTKGGKKGKGWKKINGGTDDESDDEDDEAEKVSVGGIRNVSFKIPAGKTAALVGPSGSGKTTIVRLILRMYDPDDGSVMVDSINIKSLLLQSLRSNIGVVAQDTVLFHASLRHNIMYGKEDATEEEVWEAVRISALETLVKSLPEGLDTLVGERGMKLSGGERQRVGMARCIIKSPKLILLDEATSALDSGTEREIQKNILTQETAAALCKGRTTLIIAHRLSTAMKADVILVLEKGRLVEQGTHDQLLSMGTEQSMYARMWRDQMNNDSDEE